MEPWQIEKPDCLWSVFLRRIQESGLMAVYERRKEYLRRSHPGSSRKLSTKDANWRSRWEFGGDRLPPDGEWNDGWEYPAEAVEEVSLREAAGGKPAERELTPWPPHIVNQTRSGVGDRAPYQRLAEAAREKTCSKREQVEWVGRWLLFDPKEIPLDSVPSSEAASLLWMAQNEDGGKAWISSLAAMLKHEITLESSAGRFDDGVSEGVMDGQFDLLIADGPPSGG